MTATPNPHHRRIVPKAVPGRGSVIRYHLADENGSCKPACGEGMPAGECGEDSLTEARRRWPGVPYVPARRRTRPR